MFKKIKLNKDEVIVFMGSMNAMPMMYALELKKLGYDILYFVDAPKKVTLSRPENHFPDIDYPYPSWIIETTLPNQILLLFFPKLFSALYQKTIQRKTKKKIGCFFLNGFFTALAPWLPQTSHKIGLSHGSDLNIWANTGHVQTLVDSSKRKSIVSKCLPKIIRKMLVNHIVKMQYQGYLQVDTVVFFPIGFDVMGDNVIRQLTNSGVGYVPRYDISFEPLRGQPRDFKPASGKLQLFSGVRFLFATVQSGDEGCNKGNDLIIEGIAKYFSINQNIQVHFVEKGDDVEIAKDLCRRFGLEQVVVWHKEMPFKDLLELYQRSDICFDQLGTHWIGAIGGYALWLGKPLIANVTPAIQSGIWPIDTPVCSASTAEEVFEWLTKLENEEFRMTISKKSKEFAESYMSPNHALTLMFEFDEPNENLIP